VVLAINKLQAAYKSYMREQIDLGSGVYADVWPLVESVCFQAEIEPVSIKEDDLIVHLDDDSYKYELWLYQDCLYGIKGSYSKEHQKLLILESADKDRQKFERLTAKFSSEQTKAIKYERERISEDVRIAVWRRDQGKCVSCGSRERLEYDHIVPVTRGGSNTLRNVELLCETCNRAKGNRIQ
jgi:hypothetical protein